MDEREYRLDELVDRLADLEKVDEGARLTDVAPERETWLSDNLRLLSIIGSLGPGELGLGAEGPGIDWGPLRIVGPARESDDELFLARELESDRQCWLRLLPPARLEPARGRLDLLREAEILEQIEHPGLARVRGVASHEGRTGIWAETAEGEWLCDVAKSPLSWPEACDLVTRVGEVVARLHESGLVHRRLSADRIRMGEHGPILVDLGPVALDPAAIDGGVAPEVARGAAATVRSDVHGLGRLLCRLVGHAPEEMTDPRLAPLLSAEPDERSADVPAAMEVLREIRDRPPSQTGSSMMGAIWRRLTRRKRP